MCPDLKLMLNQVTDSSISEFTMKCRVIGLNSKESGKIRVHHFFDSNDLLHFEKNGQTSSKHDFEY